MNVILPGAELKSITGKPQNDLQKAANSSAALSGAVLPNSVSVRAPESVDGLPPDLALIVRRWPALSESVKTAIMAMVESPDDGSSDRGAGLARACPSRTWEVAQL